MDNQFMNFTPGPKQPEEPGPIIPEAPPNAESGPGKGLLSRWKNQPPPPAPKKQGGGLLSQHQKSAFPPSVPPTPPAAFSIPSNRQQPARGQQPPQRGNFASAQPPQNFPQQPAPQNRRITGQLNQQGMPGPEQPIPQNRRITGQLNPQGMPGPEQPIPQNRRITGQLNQQGMPMPGMSGIQPQAPQQHMGMGNNPAQTPQPFAQQNWNTPPPRPGGRPPLADPRKPKAPKTKKKRRYPIWARVLTALLAIILLVTGGGFWYYNTYIKGALDSITGQNVVTVDENGQVITPLSTQQGQDALLTGDRVNILLLGSDNDEKFADGFPLAQTVIIISIDPQTKKVAMVSIPRDMAVIQPNGATVKLDEAFANGPNAVPGDSDSHAKAVGYMESTITKNFGIKFDYYAWVGLDGFIKVIDVADGVDIDPIHPMTDDRYPDDINSDNHFAMKRLYIAPGPQHMNGISALEYVRTRHTDLLGDFGRSERQQQVLGQLKHKLSNADIVNKIPDLLNGLKGYLKTSIKQGELFEFANFAKDLDLNAIDRVVFSPPYAREGGGSDSRFYAKCDLLLPKLRETLQMGDAAKCPSFNSSNTFSGFMTLNSPGMETALASVQDRDSMAARQVNSLSATCQTSIVKGNISVSFGRSSLSDPYGVMSLLDLMNLSTGGIAL